MLAHGILGGGRMLIENQFVVGDLIEVDGKAATVEAITVRSTTLRDFNVQDDRITGIAEELDKYTRTHELGDVIWPSYPILFTKNLGDLADEIKRRDLYLGLRARFRTGRILAAVQAPAESHAASSPPQDPGARLGQNQRGL